MLEKEYKKYLLDNVFDEENLTINQIIARLFKEKEIDLETAIRLKKILKKLLEFPNIDAFNITEKLIYKSENELDKLRLEIAYLIRNLIIINVENQAVEKDFLKLQNYLKILNEKNLSEEDIKTMKQDILFIELDNGYDFKFLVCADEYLKENVKKYYKK